MSVVDVSRAYVWGEYKYHNMSIPYTCTVPCDKERGYRVRRVELSPARPTIIYTSPMLSILGERERSVDGSRALYTVHGALKKLYSCSM